MKVRTVVLNSKKRWPWYNQTEPEAISLLVTPVDVLAMGLRQVFGKFTIKQCPYVNLGSLGFHFFHNTVPQTTRQLHSPTFEKKL